jgi:hypothetical protein
MMGEGERGGEEPREISLILSESGRLARIIPPLEDIAEETFLDKLIAKLIR